MAAKPDVQLDEDKITATPKTSLPDWRRTAAWDTLYLAGKPLPGIARVDIELPSGIDVQKPKGGKKAVVKDDGVPPAEISVELEMLPENIQAFEVLVNTLRPRGLTKPREPVEITHPLCKLWGINAVQVGQLSTPSPRAGGSFVANIQLIEWVPQPKTPKKPKNKPAASAKAGDFSDLDKLTSELDTKRPARVGTLILNDDDGVDRTPPRTP
jgi:hypothetical protein